MVKMSQEGYGSTFEIFQNIMKSSNTLHKLGLVHSQVVGTLNSHIKDFNSKFVWMNECLPEGRTLTFGTVDGNAPILGI